MNLRWSSILTVGLLAAALIIPAAEAQNPADWPMYNRDLNATRFSPLNEINTDNVTDLEVAWTYSLGENNAGGLSNGFEFTPIVTNGMLYAAAEGRVVAMDPATGEELWRHNVRGDDQPSRRAVAFWVGDEQEDARIFFTARRRLIGLSAFTGEPVARFGDGGEVDMGQPYDSAPTVYRNLLIVGTNGLPGSVRAFDAMTGEKAWEFFSIPKPGEPGSESWEGEIFENAESVAWAFSMSVDTERGLVYVMFDNPGYDYWGGNRPGTNLFGNSVVALDAATGEYRWHFQTVHHDLWDFDQPSPAVLLDLDVDGDDVPGLAIVGKSGYMFILNRETGEPIFGVEETPVPESNVPTERASPTQPIPVKPPPLARVSFGPEDLVTAEDTNAEHAAFCADLVQRSGGLANQGPFTPYTYRAPGAPPRSTIVFPGSIGGVNWGGTAADPTINYVFANTMSEASIGWVEDSPEGARTPFRRGSIVGRTSRFQWNNSPEDSGGNISGSGEQGSWLCQKPPWGELVAVDANTGDIAWRVPLGITEGLPPEKQRTGTLNMGGPMATAGGLVFIGASNDRRFRAFDSRTGDQLWVTRLDMSAHAVPISYEAAGKQYLAIVAGGQRGDMDDPGPDGSEALVVFALPE